MKKIFLSLPMSGRSDEEIQSLISVMKSLFLMKNPFDKGEEIVFVHNFQEMEVVTNTFDPLFGERKTPALYYLGRAINKMAYCDAVLFSPGYQSARGCNVEFDVAHYYDIPIYVITRDYEIRKLDKCEITKDMVWDYTEDEKECNGEKPFDNRKSGRYPWDKIEKEGFCSVCAIDKGSPTCEKCKHKEEKNNE